MKDNKQVELNAKFKAAESFVSTSVAAPRGLRQKTKKKKKKKKPGTFLRLTWNKELPH